MVTADQVKERATRTVRTVLVRDSFLLEHAVHERSITHKLAEYLQQEFPDYNVDCEYNKHGLAVKRLPRQCQDSLKEKEYVYPDIVVHWRGSDDSNLLVIEAKPKIHSLVSGCDAAKLIEFTKPDGEYRYHLGLFMCFNGLGEPKLVWFENGREESPES